MKKVPRAKRHRTGDRSDEDGREVKPESPCGASWATISYSLEQSTISAEPPLQSFHRLESHKRLRRQCCAAGRKSVAG